MAAQNSTPFGHIKSADLLVLFADNPAAITFEPTPAEKSQLPRIDVCFNYKRLSVKVSNEEVAWITPCLRARDRALAAALHGYRDDKFGTAIDKVKCVETSKYNGWQAVIYETKSDGTKSDLFKIVKVLGDRMGEYYEREYAPRALTHAEILALKKQKKTPPADCLAVPAKGWKHPVVTHTAAGEELNNPYIRIKARVPDGQAPLPSNRVLLFSDGHQPTGTGTYKDVTVLVPTDGVEIFGNKFVYGGTQYDTLADLPAEATKTVPITPEHYWRVLTKGTRFWGTISLSQGVVSQGGGGLTYPVEFIGGPAGALTVVHPGKADWIVPNRAAAGVAADTAADIAAAIAAGDAAVGNDAATPVAATGGVHRADIDAVLADLDGLTA